MTEGSTLLVDEVFRKHPVRQWALSVTYPLRFLFASPPKVKDHVLSIVSRCIAAFDPDEVYLSPVGSNLRTWLIKLSMFFRAAPSLARRSRSTP